MSANMQHMPMAVVVKPGTPWFCLMLCILASVGKAVPVSDGSERNFSTELYSGVV